MSTDLSKLPPGLYMTDDGSLVSVSENLYIISPLTPDEMLWLSKKLKRSARDLKAGRKVTGSIDIKADFGPLTGPVH